MSNCFHAIRSFRYLYLFVHCIVLHWLLVYIVRCDITPHNLNRSCIDRCCGRHYLQYTCYPLYNCGTFSVVLLWLFYWRKYLCHGVSSNVCVNIRVLNFNVCQVSCLHSMPNWFWTIVTRHIAQDVLIHYIGLLHHFKGSSDVAVRYDVIKTKGI